MQSGRTIVWGLGSGYEKRKKTLKKEHNIIALTDSNERGNQYDGLPFVRPKDLANIDYDKILVCSTVYYETIKYRLVNEYQVCEEKIIPVDYLENDETEHIVYNSIMKYKTENKNENFTINEKDLWLICDNYNGEAGCPAEHYFAQDIWGAKKIYNCSPQKHYDIGSRLDGFLAHLLVFLNEVHYIDIRPLPYHIDGLNFIQGDAVSLKEFQDQSIESISSFHAIEHFGLGRYGDAIDSDACFKAFRSIERVLKPKGMFYLGVPIGPKDRLVFNAHRIFHPKTIIDSLPSLSLIDFSIVNGKSVNCQKVKKEDFKTVCESLSDYSCGLFEFQK